MDLIEFTERNSPIRPMRDSDEAPIARLFQDKPMLVGPIRLRYDRGPEFQSLLRAQGSKFLTVVADEGDEVVFTSSVSSSRRFVDGREIGVSYLGDLRVKSSSRASRWWRKAYPDFIELIETCEELGHPERHLTAVLADNRAAIHALSRTRNFLGVRYEALRDVQMVNVMGAITKSGRHAHRMTSEQKSDVLVFIEERARARQFGYKFPEELKRRAKEWSDFAEDEFLVSEDARGIRAVCLPWAPTSHKRMVVDRAPLFARAGFSLLKMLGRTAPRVGQPLETLYLTHAYWRADVDPMGEMRAFADALSSEGVYRKFHMVSFCAHEDEWTRSSELRGLVKQVTPVSLFEVVPDGRKAADASGLVDFEMGLV